ncbi:MAG: SDR family NAD(P)-dependent oxidoreductase [Sandaracinaceae bacterium]
MGDKPVCAVMGVGPGNGAAFARRFAKEGYAVGLMARNEQYLTELASEIEGAKPFPCDATDPGAIASAFARVSTELGDVDVLLYNAGSGTFGTFDDVDADALERAWKINTRGLFQSAKAVVPAMRAKGTGQIVITGATASLRGGARFAAFAQAKAAQRSLAQSMAKHLGPDGIHVSLVIVDGMIDLPRMRTMMPDAPPERFLQPDAIADAVWHLTRQHPSAWTFELDVRPNVEAW